MLLPGAQFSINLQASGAAGHLAQVHLADSADIDGGGSVDGQSQGQTTGGGHCHAAVQELQALGEAEIMVLGQFDQEV